LNIDPDNSGILYLVSLVSFNMHDFVGAQNAIQSALEIDPVEVDCLALQAEILWTLDKNDQAMEVVRNGLALEPEHEELLLLRFKLEKNNTRAIPILKSL